MCENCIHILGKCVAPHAAFPNKCPLKTATYCCLCASYGHSVRDCKLDTTYREAQYLEQLIPPSLLEENKISSNTLIKTKMNTMPTPMKPTIDAVDDPKAIRSLLKSMDDMPSIKERDKSKYKKHLNTIAKKRGEHVVYHSLEKSDSIR
jgi:hypothetical protein